MKKTILLSVLSLVMLFNAGCTDDEVAAGAIGVIIGVGLGGGDGHHHDHRPPPYRPGRPGRRYALAITLPTTGEAAATSDVSEFAIKYNISTQTAEKVQAAFEGVKTEGLSSFAKIGLQKSDIQTLMKHELPSSSAITAMAKSLDMSEAQSRDFLVAMNHEFESQAADVTSPYWEACIAKGKWKTDENMYCKSTNWPGCSPEGGAALCY